MKRIYWKFNKNIIIADIVLTLVFFAASMLFMVEVISMDTLQQGTATDSQMITSLVKVLSSAILFGGLSLACTIVTVLAILNPFRKKQLQQIMQIGELPQQYVLLHIFVMLLLVLFTIIICIPFGLLFEPMLLRIGVDLTEIKSAISFNFTTIISSLGLIAWLISIPLCMYNEQILPNLAEKKRMFIIPVSILLFWFAISGGIQFFSFISAIDNGMVQANTALLTVSNSAILSNNIFDIKYVVDYLGIILLCISYYGFYTNFTIKR